MRKVRYDLNSRECLLCAKSGHHYLFPRAAR
jgi:hypothetical protein